MTQYRMFFAALIAAFMLSACSSGKDDMKTGGDAAEATTETAAEATTEAQTTQQEAEPKAETEQATEQSTTQQTN